MADRTPLDALLESEGEEIIDAWARALLNMSGTRYAGMPFDELRPRCATAFHAYKAFVQSRDHHLLRVFVGEVVRHRTPEGFSLAEIERALLLAKAIVRPRLVARYAGQPDIGRFSADWQRFEQATDIAVVRFSEHFHRRITADLERQLARVNKLSDQLAELVVRDDLTGLYNYRFLAPRLHEEVQRSLRYGHPLALLMADLDHFKDVNDTYGHQVGNAVLQYVGRTLRREVRVTDIVARYGGEEFAVILPETEVPEALLVAEHLRATIAANPDQTMPPITISIGLSTYQADDFDGTRLIEAADQALYEAKAGGRNCVVMSG
jgi:diguanylate cyclase (GGDEF)-like protein